MDVRVQPIYVTGMGRPSEQRELQAQKEILEALAQKKETIAEILPVRYIDAADIPQNDKIQWAYDEIKKTVALGIQYETLAQCAAMFDSVEIGSEGGLEQNLRMTQCQQLKKRSSQCTEHKFNIHINCELTNEIRLQN